MKEGIDYSPLIPLNAFQRAMPPPIIPHFIDADPLNDEVDNVHLLFTTIEELYEDSDIHKAIYLCQTEDEITVFCRELEVRNHAISYAPLDKRALDTALTTFDVGESRVLLMLYETWRAQLEFVRRHLIYDCNFICTVGLGNDAQAELAQFFFHLENKASHGAIQVLNTESAIYPWNLMPPKET